MLPTCSRTAVTSPALQQAPGNLVERGVAAQRRAGVGYPRFVAGRPYAFPYSPLFHLPFTLLPEERVVGAMKYAAVLVSVMQTGLLFAVARALGGARLALWATFLDTFLPPAYQRLVWAMWPATVGHFVDLVAVAALLFWMRRPSERLRLALLATAVFMAFVMYISGLVSIAVLLIAAALVERRQAGSLLALVAAAGLGAALLVYPPFTWVLCTEILPALLNDSCCSQRSRSGRWQGAARARAGSPWGSRWDWHSSVSAATGSTSCHASRWPVRASP